MRQATSAFQVYQRAYASTSHGLMRVKLFNMPTRCFNCNAKSPTHHAKLLQIYCCQIVRSENERYDDLVGKAGESLARDGLVRISRNCTVHVSIGVVWRVERHRGGCRGRVGKAGGHRPR